MRSELFKCQGGCGVIYPLLVDWRPGTSHCAACGETARPLSQLEVMEELRNRTRALFGEPLAVAGDLGQPVNVRAKVREAQELRDMLRFVEASERSPRGTTIRPMETDTPWRE